MSQVRFGGQQPIIQQPENDMPHVQQGRKDGAQGRPEIDADPVYGPAPQGFFDVVNDVCQANRGAAAWKVGVVTAVKFAVFGKL